MILPPYSDIFRSEFRYNQKSSRPKSFTFIQRANFSLAPGKSPACRRANPAAPHTPEGSSPHLVETSMARDSRSASINRSRRRLQQINKNSDQIKKITFSLLFIRTFVTKSLTYNQTEQNSSPSLPRWNTQQSHGEMDPPLPHRTLQSRDA